MSVSLTPELERCINEKVECGSYRSAREVVRESVRLMQRVEEDRAARPAAPRRDINEAVEPMERGEWVDGEEAFAEVLESIRRSSRPRDATASPTTRAVTSAKPRSTTWERG